MVESLQESGVKPEWMILECLPVLPPGMRPSTYLEVGGMATLDLNELYARVISRSNKYRELSAIGDQEAHEAARMVQEAVDSLLGNGRRSEGETGTLKSLSDLLKGKSGMFRSNLLGKRVDYSGRSVIVVGPDLKLDECGLPESMALELFKPFIVHKLLDSGAAHSISGAHRMVDTRSAEAREAAREIAKERLIMLNRAPTLHRIGIQAFRPVLTDASAIRLHPLVCVGFNADFDGDQMAVHIPLSSEAQKEARQLMLSQKNVLSTAHGGTIAQPSQDMIVGCYYMTMETGTDGEAKAELTNIPEVKKAYELGRLCLHDNIQFRTNGESVNTTVGRVLFNEIVPPGLGRFINRQMDKRSVFQLVEECHARLGEDETVRFLNDLDDLGFKYATRFGASVGMDVFRSTPGREKILQEAEKLDTQTGKKLAKGQTSDEEALKERLDIWDKAADKLMEATVEGLKSDSDGMNPVILMMESGARGRPGQLKSVIGLVGPITRLSDELFDTPVMSNYIEGLSILEYFMITSGARRGLIDVVIRVGRAGYLTRKMVSASQDVIITEEDCGTSNGITIAALTSGDEIRRKLSARISGRIVAQDVAHPETGAGIVSAGELINSDIAQKIEEAGIQEVKVRSPITCETNHGLCANCYGVDLSTGAMTELGGPVGVIAGTAAGEPATQLTFRIFAVKSGSEYISAGLPKLESFLDVKESVQITVDGSLMSLEDALSQKGLEEFGALMLDELMRLYDRYGLNVNDKHFEILLGCMLSQVRITDAGDTGFRAGQLVSKSRLRLANQKVGDTGKKASAEPVLMGLSRAALSTESFLAAAAFGDTLNILAQAAIRGSRDELRGMRENLIVGRLIPAGTGFHKGN
jgi:DNA-directed RNA polymerase subunit beta'